MHLFPHMLQFKMKLQYITDVVYFTDWRQGGLVAVQRTDPETAVIMRRGVDKMYAIKVYDKDEQPADGECSFY